MVGYRTRSYYKELIKIPNVRLISPMRNGHDLVQKAKLVVTLTGTVGWEAIMFKKPVITLGDVYYNDLSFVRRCKSFEDLPYIVKDQLDHFIHDEDELQVYLAALIDDSVEVNYVDLWRDASSFDEIRYDPGIKRFSELLGKKLLEK